MAIGQSDSQITDYSGLNYQQAQEKQLQIASGMPQAQADVQRGMAEELRQKNELGQINLDSTKAIIAGQKKAFADMQAEQAARDAAARQANGGAGGAGGSGNNTTGQVAPPPAGATTPPAATNAPQASGAGVVPPADSTGAPSAGNPPPNTTGQPTQAVPQTKEELSKQAGEHLSSTAYQPNGVPNPLSQEYIDRASQEMLKAGANPLDVAKYQYDSLKNRLEVQDKIAGIREKNAKGDLDIQGAQKAMVDNRNNMANDVVDLLKSAGNDPAKVAAAQQKALQQLGLDLSSPADIKTLGKMADLSPNRMATAMNTADITAKLKNADSDRMNAVTKQGELAVAQGRLGRDKLHDALEYSADAGKTAIMINNTVDTQNGVRAMIQGLQDGSLRKVGSGYVGIVANMDKSLVKSLSNFVGAKMSSDGNMYITQAQMDRLEGSGIELALGATTILGGKGPSTASDARTEIYGKSVVGSGLNVDHLPGENITNLKALDTYLDNNRQVITKSNANSNHGVTIAGKGQISIVEPTKKASDLIPMPSDKIVPGTNAKNVVGTPQTASAFDKPSPQSRSGQLSAAQIGKAPNISSQAEFDALPSGSSFTDASGNVKVKH